MTFVYEDLNQFVHISDLGEFRWYAGCRVSRDWGAGTLTISHEAFAEGLVVRFRVTRGKSTPMVVDLLSLIHI